MGRSRYLDLYARRSGQMGVKMEKIKEFDRKLIEKKGKVWEAAEMPRMFKNVLGVAGCFIMIIPVQYLLSDFNFGVVFASWVIIMGISLYLQTYTIVIENKKNISIYEKLKFMPVSQIDIFKVRLGYLGKECVRFFVVALLIQIIGAALAKQIDIRNLLYPLFVMLSVFLLLLTSLIPPLHFKRKTILK